MRTKHKWTHREIEDLKKLHLDNSNKFLAGKFNVSVSSIKNKAVKLKLIKSSEQHKIACFEKGYISWNKGLKGYRPSMDTEFKKGNLPHNTKYDGCIRLRTKATGEQYLYIRLSVTIWKLYHHFLWEKSYGSIPDGMIIIFKDKDTLNCNLENLEMIDRIENMKRNLNKESAAKSLKSTWRIEKLRVKYGRPQQTKFNVVNFY